MKIGILYIAIGAYDVFFEGFYRSCERYFLPECDREYFVFTDSNREIFLGNPKIHRIEQQNMGWPDNTMQRFRLFCSIESELESFDYLFFFNANLEFVKAVSESALPESGLIVVRHPGWCAIKNPDELPYERDACSRAYIPYGEGGLYAFGAANGGARESYLTMARELEKRTDEDTANGVTARVHDESQLNRYILDIPRGSFTVWDSGWAYPDIYYLPGVEMKAKLRSKELYIPVLGIKGERSPLRSAARYAYVYFRIALSSLRRALSAPHKSDNSQGKE